jgi:hypothetical protein
VTPTQTLDLIRTGWFQDHYLFRDPDGGVYVLAAPGKELQYWHQGYSWIGRMSDLHEACNPDDSQPFGIDVRVWIVVNDVQRLDTVTTR